MDFKKLQILEKKIVFQHNTEDLRTENIPYFREFGVSNKLTSIGFGKKAFNQCEVACL